METAIEICSPLCAASDIDVIFRTFLQSASVGSPQTSPNIGASKTSTACIRKRLAKTYLSAHRKIDQVLYFVDGSFKLKVKSRLTQQTPFKIKDVRQVRR